MSRLCIIVPVPFIQLAEALCVGLAGQENAGMYDSALEPIDGLVGHSHGIANGPIRQQFADLLPINGAPGDPEKIVQMAAYKGVKFEGQPITLAQVTVLLEAIDVTDGDPHQRMAALGLRMMQATI